MAKSDSNPLPLIHELLCRGSAINDEVAARIKLLLEKRTLPDLRSVLKQYKVVAPSSSKKSLLVTKLISSCVQEQILRVPGSSSVFRLVIGGESHSSSDWLVRGKALSSEDRQLLQKHMNMLTAGELKVIAKQVGGNLTNTSKRSEIVQRLLALSVIGASGQDHSEHEPLSYLTEEIVQELKSLPSLKHIVDWRKSLEGLTPIHFINLSAYLVESHDKTFDHQSLRALKSLKAYQFCQDAYIYKKHVGVSPPIHFQ